MLAASFLVVHTTVIFQLLLNVKCEDFFLSTKYEKKILIKKYKEYCFSLRNGNVLHKLLVTREGGLPHMVQTMKNANDLHQLLSFTRSVFTKPRPSMCEGVNIFSPEIFRSRDSRNSKVSSQLMCQKDFQFELELTGEFMGTISNLFISD